MTKLPIWEKYQQLPASSGEAAAKFIDFLLSESAKSTSKSSDSKKQRKGFGSWKGIRMSPDFDAPLEDFKEYMV